MEGSAGAGAFERTEKLVYNIIYGKETLLIDTRQDLLVSCLHLGEGYGKE